MKLRLNLLLFALAVPGLASAESPDSPERIARLAYVEGRVTFQAAQELASSTLPDRPLTRGDRLVTETGGRAELTFGTAMVRLDERTELLIRQLDATTVRVELTQGTANVQLRELFEDETFEIATPNTTLSLREPGEYRIAVPSDNTTDLTVRGGAAEALTAGGPVRIADGQRVRLEGRQALASLVTLRAADAFDNWVLERELQFVEAEPPRDTTYEGNPYEELDQYGEWSDEPSYGRVWTPSYAYGGYDPFRYGQWQQFGTSWSWVSSMPWGHRTSHSGRWAYLHDRNRWCWVPSRHDHRRHVAQDTRPFGRPRDDARPRNDGRDPQPDYRARQDDDERTAPAATSDGQPRRLHPSGAPTFRPDADSAKPRGGTIVPSPNRNPAPAPQSTPAPQPSREATVRSSRPVESRREAPAPSSNFDREAGTRQEP